LLLIASRAVHWQASWHSLPSPPSSKQRASHEATKSVVSTAGGASQATPRKSAKSAG